MWASSVSVELYAKWRGAETAPRHYFDKITSRETLIYSTQRVYGEAN